MVNVSKIAEEVTGDTQGINVVIISMLARGVELPFSYDLIKDVEREVLPEKPHSINLKALNAGYGGVVG